MRAWAWRAPILALTVAVSALAGPVSAAQTQTVIIEGNQFLPPDVSVEAGDTVTWTNHDVAPHNAVALDGTFGTERLQQNQSGSLTFSTPGTFGYQCTIHPSMRAQVIVTAAVAPPATDTAATVATTSGSASWALLAGLALASLLVSVWWPRRRMARQPRD
ncbi:MAG TPA: cupredoxin family copper-binding protein [Patescibacteria group bacterium]|nr:cupredoxin family copper-binding protein [Patescibacteria group bacterium]